MNLNVGDKVKLKDARDTKWAKYRYLITKIDNENQVSVEQLGEHHRVYNCTDASQFILVKKAKPMKKAEPPSRPKNVCSIQEEG